MEYTPRLLHVGEKVYIRKGSWLECTYVLGEVVRVTPTGLYVIRHEGIDTTFHPDGRRRGNSYRTRSIDWTPVQNISEMIAAKNRLRKAVNATREIFDLERPQTTWDLESLTALLDKVMAQTLVAKELAKQAK